MPTTRLVCSRGMASATLASFLNCKDTDISGGFVALQCLSEPEQPISGIYQGYRIETGLCFSFSVTREGKELRMPQLYAG
ncbi:hypothetical protein BDV09DRAFT_176236 [Aspergillus tetrazonus]